MAFHLYPRNDYQEHTLVGLTCKCKPKLDTEPDGEILFRHNSYDEREDRELTALEAYGKEWHKFYEGNDIAKKSMIYYNFLNFRDRNPHVFTVDNLLETRSGFTKKIKIMKETGKEEIGLWPEQLEGEIAGCDLILNSLLKVN